MSELVGVIQQIVQNTVQAMKPADIATGTVISASPLSVQPDIHMPPLPEKALILTDTVRERIVDVQRGEGGAGRLRWDRKEGSWRWGSCSHR